MTFNNLRLFIVNAIDHIGNPIYFSREAGERGFCYEVYHQMKNLWGNTGFENNLVLSTEIKKNMANSYLYPDFVIHEFANYNNQLMAIEVKNNLSSNIRRRVHDKSLIRHDIDKLISYQQPVNIINIDQNIGGLNYTVGVFLAINTTQEDMHQYMLSIGEGLQLEEFGMNEFDSDNEIGDTKHLFGVFRHIDGQIECKNIKTWLLNNLNN